MTMFQPAIGAHDLEELVAKYQKQLNLEALAYLESRDLHEKTISNFASAMQTIKLALLSSKPQSIWRVALFFNS